MATYFVDKTGIVTTASTDGDSILIQSAAMQGATLLGLDGNDTIDLSEGAAANTSAVGLNVEASSGDDSITVSSLLAFSAGGHTIKGGAGADTINISGSTLAFLKGNEGADIVTLSGGTYSSIGLAAGADDLKAKEGTFSEVFLGDGHDIFSATSFTNATATSVKAGAGNDTINLVAIAASTLSAATYNGGDGKDSIIINALDAAATVRGNEGSDTITISGDVSATTAFIAGNAGADLITVSGVSVGTTIAGGSGSDTITIADSINGVSALVIGGSGADSIAFNDVNATDTFAKASISGGAGADSITFSAADSTDSGATLGTLVYSSFSESNLENTDVFQQNGFGSTGGFTLVADYADALTAITVNEVSAAVLVSDADFSGNIASNVVTLSGTNYNVSSVTAVAGTVDTLTLAGGANTTVLFSTKTSDGLGHDYLFVQGGSAGTADDSIVSIGNFSGGVTLTVGGTNTAASMVTLSGQI